MPLFFQTLNYELTAAYLTLVVNYVSLLILLSRVDDRKAVLGLYNTAHELQSGQSDAAFPRLGQMILDYDPPLKKLADDFSPHARVRTTNITEFRAQSSTVIYLGRR